MIDEACRGGLAVAARDAHHLGLRITSRKLYLADDGYARLLEFLYHGSLLGNARTLHHLVGIHEECLRVLSFFPLHAVLVENLLVVVLYLAHVADKDIKSFDLGQCCGTHSALGGS